VSLQQECVLTRDDRVASPYFGAARHIGTFERAEHLLLLTAGREYARSRCSAAPCAWNNMSGFPLLISGEDARMLQLSL